MTRMESDGQALDGTAPVALDYGCFQSLRDLFETACAAHTESVAFVQMGRSLSYGQLEELSGHFAAYLQKVAGLQKGERFAIVLPNVLQYPIAMFGAIRCGLAIVNTNPLYTAPELEKQLNDSGATAVLVLENVAHVLAQVLPRTNVRHVFVTSAGDFLGFPKSLIVNHVIRRSRKQASYHIDGAVDFKEAVASGRRLTLDRVPIGHDDLAFLQYTGGTTGGPKGAMLSHLNVCANVLQCEAWLDHFFDEPHVLITTLPLYHIFALTVNCLLFLRLGWTNVLILNPRDSAGVVKEMRRHRFAFLTGVNTLFKALLETPGFSSLDFGNLRLTLAGGMALEQKVAWRWKSFTGTELIQAWGLTETSPGACINPRSAGYNGSVGLPIPCTQISVKDDEGMDLGTGDRGEICVRGPQVMAGYWNRPDETAKALLPGGWLRTGDIGYVDQKGYVFIEDRKKDVIVVSGFSVYSNEVESVILTHPGVQEVAAIAQPNERSGEAVVVFVVPKVPTLTERDVLDHARKFLTGYKVPKHVYFRAELPKTNIGKISKQELRNQLTEVRARHAGRHVVQHEIPSPASCVAAPGADSYP